MSYAECHKVLFSTHEFFNHIVSNTGPIFERITKDTIEKQYLHCCAPIVHKPWRMEKLFVEFIFECVGLAFYVLFLINILLNNIVIWLKIIGSMFVGQTTKEYYLKGYLSLFP